LRSASSRDGYCYFYVAQTHQDSANGTKPNANANGSARTEAAGLNGTNRQASGAQQQMR
jgi:hypothetical protein